MSNCMPSLSPVCYQDHAMFFNNNICENPTVEKIHCTVTFSLQFNKVPSRACKQLLLVKKEDFNTQKLPSELLTDL